MRLLKASGLLVVPTEAEVRAAGAWDGLVEAATAFLRVGTVSATEWADLEPVERSALTEAAEVVLAERAAAHGFAAQSTEAAMAVGARSDGGRTLSSALLARAVAETARAAPHEPPVPVDGAP
jgi:hypothetical protein